MTITCEQLVQGVSRTVLVNGVTLGVRTEVCKVPVWKERPPLPLDSPTFLSPLLSLIRVVIRVRVRTLRVLVVDVVLLRGPGPGPPAERPRSPRRYTGRVYMVRRRGASLPSSTTGLR